MQSNGNTCCGYCFWCSARKLDIRYPPSQQVIRQASRVLVYVVVFVGTLRQPNPAISAYVRPTTQTPKRGSVRANPRAPSPTQYAGRPLQRNGQAYTLNTVSTVAMTFPAFGTSGESEQASKFMLSWVERGIWQKRNTCGSQTQSVCVDPRPRHGNIVGDTPWSSCAALWLRVGFWSGNQKLYHRHRPK
eukprot:5001663-Amphidinium_carterae.1